MSKLAFCFIVIDGLNQYEKWVQFFRGIPASKYTIYAHCKNTECDLGWFNKFKLKETVPTKWGDVSIVKAQNLLYEEALKDPENYKFINVSQSCIPIQDFDYIYEYLTKDDMSIISKCSTKQCFPRCNSLLKHLPSEAILKSSQWMVLNREHTTLCVMNEGFISLFENISCPDEHFNIIIINRRGNINKLRYEETTYTNWDDDEADSPKTYTQISQFELNDIKNEGYLFARKFDKSCKI
jgi:hypothetical protein